jgi:hypothetical protein
MPATSSNSSIPATETGKPPLAWFIIFNGECEPVGAARARTDKGAVAKFAAVAEMNPGGFYAERLSSETPVTIFDTFKRLK